MRNPFDPFPEYSGNKTWKRCRIHAPSWRYLDECLQMLATLTLMPLCWVIATFVDVLQIREKARRGAIDAVQRARGNTQSCTCREFN